MLMYAAPEYIVQDSVLAGEKNTFVPGSFFWVEPKSQQIGKNNNKRYNSILMVSASGQAAAISGSVLVGVLAACSQCPQLQGTETLGQIQICVTQVRRKLLLEVIRGSKMRNKISLGT